MKYTFNKRAELVTWFSHLHREGEDIYPLTVTVNRRSKRTNDQNRLLWATYRSIADQMTAETQRAITPEHIHGACRAMFAPRERCPVTGMNRSMSTAGMSKAELGDYYDQVCAWATGELGYEL